MGKTINKEIDLSNIPKYKSGSNYDWRNSIGAIVNFTYGDIIGSLKIIEYIGDKELVVSYNDLIYPVKIDSLLKCSLGKVLGKIPPVIKIGDIIETSHGNLKIIAAEQIKPKGRDQMEYTYECLECGHIGKKMAAGIRRKYSCEKCGASTSFTRDEYIDKVKQIVGEEYSVIGDYTNKKTNVQMRHNVCGHEYGASPNNFLRGKRCPKCALHNKYSYMHIALYQYLRYIYPQTRCEEDIGFKGNKGGVSKYDIYVPELNMIIECQSAYHDGKEVFDARKKKFAINKGYEFLSFDHREYSPLQAIQYFDRSITILPEYIDYSEFQKTYNWDDLQEKLNNGETLIEITKNLDIGKSVLYDAIQFGLLVKPSGYKRKLTVESHSNKAVVKLDIDGNYLEKYKSITEASSLTGISKNTIGKVCRKICQTAGGFRWIFYDEYIGNIDNYKQLLYINQVHKRVRCVTTNEVFEKIVDAAKKYNISASGISECCSGKLNYSGKLNDGTKLRWEYVA